MCENGAVYYADDSGHCDQLNSLPGNPQAAFLQESRNMIVSVNADLILTRSNLMPDGKLGQIHMVITVITACTHSKKVKLAAGSRLAESFQVCLIQNILAISIPDQSLRIFDYVNDDSPTLSILLDTKVKETLTGMVWSDSFQSLAGISDLGLTKKSLHPVAIS